MGKIVAIGGAHMTDRAGVSAIDKTILNGIKNSPSVLFIPTASDDDQQYIELANNHFKRIGCKKFDTLLLSQNPGKKECKDKIDYADIIYVGGGNTLRMMIKWRKFGVDSMLKRAYFQDKVLCGTSAGAICWFKYGNSDSRKYTSNSDQLIRVSGLGLVDSLLCPHYDSEPLRRPDLKRMMRAKVGVAIALQDHTAIEIIDNRFRIASNKNTANAFKVYWKDNDFHEEQLVKDKKHRDLKQLLTK